jgi:hypothetical protein
VDVEASRDGVRRRFGLRALPPNAASHHRLEKRRVENGVIADLLRSQN